MPYGIETAPEIFHILYTEIFNDIKIVAVYIDDILVWAENKAELEDPLIKVFTEARDNRVKLNLSKCELGVNSVRFLGHISTENGIKIGNSRIEAIKNIKTPNDQNAVKRLLGVFTYISRFVPNMRQK